METAPAIIRFKAIELLSKSLNRPEKGEFLGSVFHFDIKAGSFVNESQRAIVVVVDVSVREADKEIVVAKISAGFVFEVDNFNESILKGAGDLYTIPNEADSLVKSVALSTVRGIMFSEFRGTFLAGAIMPILIIQPTSNEIEQVSK